MTRRRPAARRGRHAYSPSSWEGELGDQRVSSELAKLKAQSTPIPGRPGWRLDREGRSWYSSEWL